MTNKPFGVEELNVVGSAGTALIESVTDLHIRVGGGCTVGIGTSGVNIQDGTADANNDSVLNVGIVTANTYYGNFRGTIDPITSSITLNANLTDLLGISGNELSAVDANADKIMFWDDDPGKATYLTVGTGLDITGTTLTATTDAGKTYTLPVTGTTGGDGVGEAIWTLTDDLTPTPGTDPVTLKAGANISIDASSVGSGEFTIAAVQGAGLALDATVTDVLDLTSGTLSADDPGADRIIFWDETATKLTHLTVGSGLDITDTTLTATSAAGKTYTLPVTGSDGTGGGTGGSGSATLTLTDNVTPVPGTDPVAITAGSGIVIDDISEGGFRLSANSDAGKSYTLPTFGTTNGGSGLRLTGSDSTTDDVNITGTGGITVVGNAGNDTLTIDGGGAGSNTTYTLPLTGGAGPTGHATWTLTPSSGTSNSVTLNAGTNVSISSLDTTGDEYGFTIDVASGAGITFTGVAVKQYSDNAIPRTERTCADPIVVNVDSNLATIGIGNTSNAYGERYIQATEPSGSCDGDIWYDTSSGGGSASNIPVGGIIMWSGTIADIPTNWALCDGNNGTPNLLGRFVIPADIDHDFGSGDVAATTITSGATVTGGSADAVVVSHYHGYDKRNLGSVHSFGDSDQTRPQNDSFTSTLTTNAYDSTGSSMIGVDGTYKNLPPYYALAYIMRTS